MKILGTLCLFISLYHSSLAQIPNRSAVPNYLLRDDDFIDRRYSDNMSGSFDLNYYKVWLKTEELKTKVFNKKGNEWTPVGPFGNEQLAGTGRVNSVEFDPQDSATIYICVAQGGVWKSTNSGKSWLSISGDLPVLRTSSLAVHPKNSDTMYVALGDFAYIGHNLMANENKRNSHYGLGIYKTTNGGLIWQPTGLSFKQTDFEGSLICRVFIHPTIHSRVIAVGQSGSYISENSGETWLRTDTSLFWDLERSPGNANMLYATTGYVTAYDYGKAGIMRSYDFGKTWIRSGVPFKETREVQRIELAVSPSDPSRVYAIAGESFLNKEMGMSVGFYGFYISSDSGKTFTTRKDNTYKYNLMGSDFNKARGGQANYDLAFLVDKNDRDRVYIGGINAWTTTDAGNTFLPATYWSLNYYHMSLHADIHEFKQHPDGRVFACHDGGLSSSQAIIGDHPDSLNNGIVSTKWHHYTENLNITSYYRLGLHPSTTKSLLAGAQDNSTTYLNNGEWINTSGGDGMECQFSRDEQYIYSSSQYGNIYQYYKDGEEYFYQGRLDIPGSEQGEWTTPFREINNNVYVLYGNLYKYDGPGFSEPLSAFANLPGKNYASPGTALSIKPSNTDSVYVTKRGYVSQSISSQTWVTMNGGNSWKNISSGLPTSLYPSYIASSDTNFKNVWITYSGFEEGKKIYKSKDAGGTWENISYNLPNIPVNCVAYQNDKNANVYIGTDLGVYYLDEIKKEWILFSNNLPNVIVSELEVHLKDFKLVAATFGTGIWETALLGEPDKINIASVKENIEMKIEPNPAHESISVHLIDAGNTLYDLSIINISGQVVLQKSILTRTSSDKIDIDLDGFLSGEYFLILTNGNSRAVEKFIKCP